MNQSIAIGPASSIFVFHQYFVGPHFSLVFATGSELPIGLYTFDVNVDAIPRPANFIGEQTCGVWSR
jgi:hypothetical protein